MVSHWCLCGTSNANLSSVTAMQMRGEGKSNTDVSDDKIRNTVASFECQADKIPLTVFNPSNKLFCFRAFGAN